MAPLLQIGQRRQARERSSCAKPVQALFGVSGDTIDSLGNVILLGGVVAALSASALPLARSGRGLFDVPEGDPGDINDDDIKWTVMGVISCIPLVNWTAWIFGALDDPSRAARYYTFAALYFLPYLKEGIRLDTVVLLAVAAGALHLQVERVASQLPPPGPPPPSPPPGGGRSDARQPSSSSSSSSGGQWLLDTDRKTSGAPVPRQQQQQGDPRQRSESDLWGRKQLSEWDQVLQRREGEGGEGKQQEQQQRGDGGGGNGGGGSGSRRSRRR